MKGHAMVQGGASAFGCLLQLKPQLRLEAAPSLAQQLPCLRGIAWGCWGKELSFLMSSLAEKSMSALAWGYLTGSCLL